MPSYPGGVYSPRTKSNKEGVIYDPNIPTTLFAEDITLLDAEVVGIETDLVAKVDQAVKQASSPTFNGLTLSGGVLNTAGNIVFTTASRFIANSNGFLVVDGADLYLRANTARYIFIADDTTAQTQIGAGGGLISLKSNVSIDNTKKFTRGVYVVSKTINYNDTSPVAICSVGNGETIQDVYVYVTTKMDGDGGESATIGDSTDNDGFLSIPMIASGYYVGASEGLRGPYLWYVGGPWPTKKTYTGNDTINCYITKDNTTEGDWTVYVVIQKLF